MRACQDRETKKEPTASLVKVAFWWEGSMRTSARTSVLMEMQREVCRASYQERLLRVGGTARHSRHTGASSGYASARSVQQLWVARVTIIAVHS